MSNRHRYTQHWTDGELMVIECEDCGYRHLWPLPSMSELRETYGKSFGGSVRAHFREKKKKDSEHWRRVFTRRLREYERLLPGVKKPRVLDVGCGVGDFLAFCRERGWGVWGVEPSINFQQDLKEREIPVVPCLIEDVTPEQWREMGPFDVVNMSMFLEHVLEPVAALQAAMGALAPGGILSLECPNDFNPLQQVAAEGTVGRRWWISPLHINYFDFESLEGLCRRVGCTPVSRSTQFPLEIFLLFGDQYVDEPEIGQTIHTKRMRFEEALVEHGQAELLDRLYQSLANLNLGRQVTVFARKKAEGAS